MKIPLKEFQADAVAQLLRRLRTAIRDVADAPQTVTLSAPTGSGKTLIAAAAMERLLEGDDEHQADSEAVFLWLSDQPQVNEQTRRKILDTSSVFGEAQITVISSDFEERRFKPGHLYFLNIQKLGRDKLLTEHGDEREFSIWDTIENTTKESPEHFFVVVDEAHRGTLTTTASVRLAETIVQKFIKGSDREIGPVRLLVGISATPERFRELLATSSRGQQPVVEVRPEQVRESGLIKERITLFSPKDQRVADMTMLREAARDLGVMADHWSSYVGANGEPPVNPILVVQVQNEQRRGEISATPIGEAIRVINATIGPLTDHAYAHAFQDEALLRVDGHEVRYLAPPDIQGDSSVRVVFFKTSLNTGWDCPRAEVMMSFRPSEDPTSIAQLVGRMVRAPLARRIDSDDILNRVGLYLPHYDAETVTRVVDYLSRPGSEYNTGTEVETGDETILLVKARGMEDAFTAVSPVPTYSIPRSRKTPGPKRLMRLARLLAEDSLLEDSVELARAHIRDIIDSALKSAEPGATFRDQVSGRAKLRVRSTDWLVGAGIQESGFFELDLSKDDVEAEFEAAGRKFSEGIHRDWWQARVRSGVEPGLAKREIIVLSTDPQLLARIEEGAQARAREWLSAYENNIHDLPERRRQLYEVVWELSVDPEPRRWGLGDVSAISVRGGGRPYQRHMYVREADQTFTTRLNEPEARVVEREVENSELQGWFRNFERQRWSLRIPYKDGESWRGLCPDFVFVRSNGTQNQVDIVDPHGDWLSDAVPKAHGLVDYAERHAAAFGKIEMVLPEGELLYRLDLKDPKVREEVRKATSRSDLRAVFLRHA